MIGSAAAGIGIHDYDIVKGELEQKLEELIERTGGELVEHGEECADIWARNMLSMVGSYVEYEVLKKYLIILCLLCRTSHK